MLAVMTLILLTGGQHEEGLAATGAVLLRPSCGSVS